MRRTLLRSTLATGRSLEKERRTRFDFLRRKWLRRCFRRRSFPLPVILKRFAVALCVFILGIALNTSLISLYQLGFCLFSCRIPISSNNLHAIHHPQRGLPLLLLQSPLDKAHTAQRDQH